MINKVTFLNTLYCPVLGWLTSKPSRNANESIDFSTQFHLFEGNEIGKKARDFFNDGILVDDKNTNSARKMTERLINNKKVQCIYEGLFIHDAFVTRPDILFRENKKAWNIIEVKSGINLKEEYIQDIAYTAMVLKECGIVLNNSILYLLYKDYRRNTTNKPLFIGYNVTEETNYFIQKYDQFKRDVIRIINQDKKPSIDEHYKCKGCPHYSICFGEMKRDHLFYLPRINEKKYDELKSMNINSIKQIPETFKLSATQKPVRDSLINNCIIHIKDLRKLLDTLEWPVYYLDFETMTTALPLYDDVAPYTQIPTQFSIHKCISIDTIDLHFEYLSENKTDCRKVLTEKLIDALSQTGSILTYSSFEKRIINELVRLFPQLSNKLELIINRLVDLENIVKAIYHPDFFGSYSIKKVLPALVPKMSYENLEINNGSDAMSVFAMIELDLIQKDDIPKIRENLLKYCEQDTLAMVKLHSALSKL